MDDEALLLTLSKSPFQTIESRLLHWIANDSSIIEFHKGMGRGEAKSGFTRSLLHVDKLTWVLRTVDISQWSVTRRRKLHSLDAGNTLQDQVLRSNSSRLVEAAHIHASGEGNAEGFRAENGYGAS